jgi:hypothetical protein
MIETDNTTTDLRGVIAQRAYELYQLRGAHPGREFEDWLEAEREVLSANSPAFEAQTAPKPTRKRAAKTPATTATPRKRTKKQEEQ